MTELAKAPPTSYWNELRRHEQDLFTEANVHSPVLYGAEAVAVWQSGAADGIDVHELVAYYGATPIRKWRGRMATLATFDEPSIVERERTANGEARVFELQLAQGKESLQVYAAWLPLEHHGLNPDGAVAQQKAKKFYAKTFQLAPTETDYELVREQLRRGASGIDRIRHPNEY